MGTVIDFKAAPKDIPSIGDLQVPIHPIFRRANFDADLDYDLFRPALQLASKFISTPSLLPFWYTTFFSDIRPAKFVIHAPYPVPSYEYVDFPSALTDEQILRTQRALLHMRHKVRFHLDPDGNVKYSDNAAAYTDPTTEPIGIHLTPFAIAELAAGARKLADGSVSNTLYRFESVLYAILFCHELAHAACHVARGERGYYYYPGAAVSEDGWAFETWAFGGLMRISYGDPETARTTTPSRIKGPDVWTATSIRRFPRPFSVAGYLISESDIGLRLTEDRPPICREKSDNGYPIERFDGFHPDYCHEIWQEKFWKTEVRKRGVEALRPEPWGPRGLAAMTIEEQRMMLGFYRRNVEKLKTKMSTDAELEELDRLCVTLQELYDFWSDVV